MSELTNSKTVTQGEPEPQWECVVCDFSGTGDSLLAHASVHHPELLRRPAQPSPVVQKCPTCGSPERNKCFGHCPDKWHDGYEPLGIYGTSVAPVVPVGETKDTCLLCHWEPDEKKGEHLPKVVSGAVYVCTECDTRCKTVDSFGLTIEELRKAAAAYKSALPATEKEK